MEVKRKFTMFYLQKYSRNIDTLNIAQMSFHFVLTQPRRFLLLRCGQCTFSAFSVRYTRRFSGMQPQRVTSVASSYDNTSLLGKHILGTILGHLKTVSFPHSK
jgi:hypothetical protein